MQPSAARNEINEINELIGLAVILSIVPNDPTLSLLITLTYVNRFSELLADVHCRKLAEKMMCINKTPNAFCVTTLPCKILIAILVTFFHCNKNN